VDAPVSERLYYTMLAYLMPVLQRMDGRRYQPVALTCRHLESRPTAHAGGVGVGVSCGVDSLFTIAEHTRPTCPPHFRISHLAYYNVGAHTRREDQTTDLFQQREVRVRAFADEVGLPLVTLDSNVDRVLSSIPFTLSHGYRNAAATLALQNLFTTYYYSSSSTIDQLGFDAHHPSYLEPISLPMLSSNHLNFFTAGTMHTRTDKTRVVAEYAPSYRHLNVCVIDAENCSHCHKCLRTMLTLDILGRLDRDAHVFDLARFRQLKSTALTQHSDRYSREILEAIEAHGYAIPSEVHRRYLLQRIRGFLAQNKTLRGWYHAMQARQKAAP